jgi:sulfate/thiosulfate transport system substrate-binding protein
MLNELLQNPIQFGKIRYIIAVLFCSILFNLNCGKSGEDASEVDDVTILNVSYDPTRELYQEFNKAFIKYWQEKTGQMVTINQSHGGAGKQARAVIDGLEADVVTLALAYDIDAIHQAANLLDKDWQKEFSHNSSPYTSTIVFLVRKGNPKNIKDWDDLARKDVSVITPNPKTSGGARWNYLAAWAFAKKKFDNDEKQILSFISKIIKNVPVFDAGARGSTNTFVQREIGDVFISWENEAILVNKEIGKGNFEIIYPSISILAEPPVAVIDKIVDKKGTREVAAAYLEYLYSDVGQEIVGRYYYRPSNQNVLTKYKDQFPDMELVTIDDDFGGWKNAQEKHFLDGGTFDQVVR